MIRLIVDENSLRILISTTPVTAKTMPYFIILGIIKIINNNLTSCSIMFDMTYGSIFTFPKKYPFKIFDKQIKGRVKLMATIG